MAVLGRLLLGSSERLDLPDLLSIDSFTAADFKYLVQSFVGGDTPYILKGLDVIQPQDSIGTQSISIRIANSVVYAPNELAGSFFYGLEEGSEFALPLVPELRKNALNYVYVSMSTFDTARDSRAFWDPDQNGGAGGEFSQDVNTESALTVDVNVSVSGFPEGSIPICKVDVGPNVINSIEDARNMMFRLGAGGTSPDPFNEYAFRNNPTAAYARLEPPTVMASALDPNPFQGGDKNIFTLKEWMDAVMTKIKELGNTTYWYEGSGVPSTGNIFLDALGSTLKSKGEWIHDSSIAGRVTWTEDIQWKSLLDPRAIIFRDNADPAAPIDIPNGHVAYWSLVRGEEINGTTTQVTWDNTKQYVNGVVGSFENLSQGDWVKRISDSDDKYLRVEEFYAAADGGGGTTTAALAQSIELSGIYGGASVNELGVYTKGEYQPADIIISETSNPTLQDEGDQFFWFAYRSDTILNVDSIIQTELTLDITDGDGVRALCTETILADHGLQDGDRISITTGSYTGTYKIDVESATEFYIETATAVDELGQTGYYAIVTTGAVDSSNGFPEESERHNFEPDQYITIAGTASIYDDAHLINVKSDTELQIPIDAAVAPIGTVGTVSLPRVNVRTEFGTVKVVQGESIDIGDPDTTNILSYVGMDSLAQTKPTYVTPLNYNALDGHANYNTNPNDDLTERASKLTAMMADRVQDRSLQFIGNVNITHETNGLNQDISASGTVTVKKISSPDQVIDLTVSLPANSVAVANIDRDGGGAIVLAVESLGAQFLLEENKLPMFWRFGDTTVHTWEGVRILNNGHYTRENPEESQNRNVEIVNPGKLILDAGTGDVFIDVATCPEITDIACLSVAGAGMDVATGLSFLLNSALDATDYYVWYNVTDGVAQADPTSASTGIQVDVLLADTADDVATKTAAAIDLIADFNASSVGNLVTVANVIEGETTDTTDVDTGFTFYVVSDAADPDIDIIIPGSTNFNTIDVSAINLLGTLSVQDGDSVWVRIDRLANKIFNQILLADAPSSIDTVANGALFITPTSDVPTDQDVFVIFTRHGDGLAEFHKTHQPDSNIYEELLEVVAIATNDNEMEPFGAGGTVILPLDSRDNDLIQKYIVGAGHLHIWLNGQPLTPGVDFEELGDPNCPSNKFQLNQAVIIGDVVTVRIDGHGGIYFAKNQISAASLQDTYDIGRFITTGAGQPVTVMGPANENLVRVLGDMEIDGILTSTTLGDLQYTTETDGVTSGANADMLAGDEVTRILTNGLLTSARTLAGGNEGRLHVLVNRTGNDLVLLNDFGAEGFISPTGSDIPLLNDSAIYLLYDSVVSRWRIIGATEKYRIVNPTTDSLVISPIFNALMTGTANTAFGIDAASSITTGNQNTLFGFGAGSSVDTGSGNTAIGNLAGTNITEGFLNTVYGYQAGAAITTGDRNTIFGANAGTGITSGNDSVFVGYGAGRNVSTGAANTLIGHDSATLLTTGNNNTTLGYRTGAGLTGGGNNVLVGYEAGQALENGAGNVFIGFNAARTTTVSNNAVVIGLGAAEDMTTASDITIIGYNAGNSLTTGGNNTIMGYSAGAFLSTGVSNVIVGGAAASNTFNANQSVIMGVNACETGSPSNSVIIGYGAGQSALSTGTTCIGYLAGQSATSSIIAIGERAGQTGGSQSIYIGIRAGSGNTGAQNTHIGTTAGLNSSSGAFCTYVGGSSGQSNTGNRNVFLGYNSGSVSGATDDNIFIGYSAGSSSVDSDRLIIQNSNNIVTPLIDGQFLSAGGTRPAFLKVNGRFQTTWTVISGATTALRGDKFLADTSGGAFTVTLPASPSEGDTVTIADAGGTFGTNNLTIDRNGENIVGSATDLVLNIDDQPVTLVYYDAARGWVLGGV